MLVASSADGLQVSLVRMARLYPPQYTYTGHLVFVKTEQFNSVAAEAEAKFSRFAQSYFDDVFDDVRVCAFDNKAASIRTRVVVGNARWARHLMCAKSDKSIGLEPYIRRIIAMLQSYNSPYQFLKNWILAKKPVTGILIEALALPLWLVFRLLAGLGPAPLTVALASTWDAIRHDAVRVASEVHAASPVAWPADQGLWLYDSVNNRVVNNNSSSSSSSSSSSQSLVRRFAADYEEWFKNGTGGGEPFNAGAVWSTYASALQTSMPRALRDDVVMNGISVEGDPHLYQQQFHVHIARGHIVQQVLKYDSDAIKRVLPDLDAVITYNYTSLFLALQQSEFQHVSLSGRPSTQDGSDRVFSLDISASTRNKLKVDASTRCELRELNSVNNDYHALNTKGRTLMIYSVNQPVRLFLHRRQESSNTRSKETRMYLLFPGCVFRTSSSHTTADYGFYLAPLNPFSNSSELPQYDDAHHTTPSSKPCVLVFQTPAAPSIQPTPSVFPPAEALQSLNEGRGL